MWRDKRTDVTNLKGALTCFVKATEKQVGELMKKVNLHAHTPTNPEITTSRALQNVIVTQVHQITPTHFIY
jgi:hypothetical protein